MSALLSGFSSLDFPTIYSGFHCTNITQHFFFFISGRIWRQEQIFLLQKKRAFRVLRTPPRPAEKRKGSSCTLSEGRYRHPLGRAKSGSRCYRQCSLKVVSQLRSARAGARREQCQASESLGGTPHRLANKLEETTEQLSVPLKDFAIYHDKAK